MTRFGGIGTVILIGSVFVAIASSAAEEDDQVTRGIASFTPISEISTDIRIKEEDLPEDQAANLFGSHEPYSRAAVNRVEWLDNEFAWVPAEFLHKPTYLNEVPLELHGQTGRPALQPALSGVHFFTHVALMPYKLLVDHPYGYVSPLGYYRVGSPAPPLREKLGRGIDPRWLHPSGYWLHH